MATIDVKDAGGSTVAVEKPNTNGQQASAGSRPVTLSTEQEGLLGDILTEQQAANALLGATPTALPHQPLDATSDLTHGFVTSSSSGEQDMITATASQTSRIHRMTITAAAATVIEIRDGAGGTALKTVEFPGAGAYVFDFSERPYVKSSANTKLVRNSTVATKVTIDFEYVKSA